MQQPQIDPTDPAQAVALLDHYLSRAEIKGANGADYKLAWLALETVRALAAVRAKPAEVPTPASDLVHRGPPSETRLPPVDRTGGWRQGGSGEMTGAAADGFNAHTDG